MYTTRNFKTKKALKEAVANGEKITYYDPGVFGTDNVRNGIIYVAGPHYPEPHKWYAECVVENGFITKVK